MYESIRRDLISGLIVVVPLLITGFVLWWLVGFLLRIPAFGVLAEAIPVVGAAYPGMTRLILTVVTLFTALMVVGVTTRTAAGRLIDVRFEQLMNRLPGLRIVYNGSRVAIETLVSGDSELERPVKVEVWGSARMTAFHTGARTKDGRIVLFLPTSPNITSGYVIEVEEEDIIEIDEGLESALIRVLSAGFADASDAERYDIDVVIAEESQRYEWNVSAGEDESTGGGPPGSSRDVQARTGDGRDPVRALVEDLVGDGARDGDEEAAGDDAEPEDPQDDAEREDPQDDAERDATDEGTKRE